MGWRGGCNVTQRREAGSWVCFLCFEKEKWKDLNSAHSQSAVLGGGGWLRKVPGDRAVPSS